MGIFDKLKNALGTATKALNEKSENLSPIEISFMKYLEGKTPFAIAEYWKNEPDIDIDKTIKKLLAEGYLEHKKIIGNNLTINDLKELLAKKNIKATGKKEELLIKAQNAYNDTEIASMDFPEVFCFTEKGGVIARETPSALTHNHILEKECLDLIKSGNSAIAYKKLCSYEAKKPIPRGMGIDWNYEATIADKRAKRFVASATVLGDFNIDDKDIIEAFRSIIIFCDMLGKPLPSKKYIKEWIPELNIIANKNEIEKACKVAYEKYNDFEYPAFNKKTNEKNFDKWGIDARKGYCLDLLEKYEESIPIYENLIAQSCDIPAVYKNLKSIYKKYNEKESAKRIDERLKALNKFNGKS